MRKVLTRTIVTLSSICLVLIHFPYLMMADSNEEELSIHLSPQGVLYDVENMKPGDWAPRQVTVKNNGKRDFSYHIRIDNNGPEKLFKELLLEIEVAGHHIYKGKINDFSRSPSRLLETGQQDELEFTIRFPEYLDNDYQGLDTQFSLSFIAVDEDNQSIPPDTSQDSTGNDDSNYGPAKDKIASLNGTIGSSGSKGGKLPKTSTNIYDILIIGVVLTTSGGIIAAYGRKRRKT